VVALKKKNTTLERLLKGGTYSELFGLIQGYKLENVIKKIQVWGIVGKRFWTRERIETILAPYRNYSRQQNLSEKKIDLALQSFAKATETDINLVRRVFYQIAVDEPEENPEEIIEEAEEELPEFEDEEEAEEAEPEEKSD